MKWIAITAALLGVAGSTAAQPTAETQPTGSAPPDHPMMGEAAPAFRLPALDGKEIALADYAGSYVVMHFGASW